MIEFATLYEWPSVPLDLLVFVKVPNTSNVLELALCKLLSAILALATTVLPEAPAELRAFAFAHAEMIFCSDLESTWEEEEEEDERETETEAAAGFEN